MSRAQISYAELHCVSNFSFLRGASHPEELVKRAAELSYAGLALTDECSVAGVVRAHMTAKESALKFIIGSEFIVTETPATEIAVSKIAVTAARDVASNSADLKLVVLATCRASYGALCELITRARRQAAKGQYVLERALFDQCLANSQCLVLWLPDPHADDEQSKLSGAWLKARFADRLWIAVEHLADGRVRAVFHQAQTLSQQLGLPMLASGNVHMHDRRRGVLQDTLTAIRLGKSLPKAGFELYPNGERCLRSVHELERLYPRSLLNETLAVLERIDFSLDELRYEYPHELVPEGLSPGQHLRLLTEQGMQWRWPAGVPDHVVRLIEHELKLIAELRYEPYFLTVHDIVLFAREQKILCQGRGSAANSAVCYCLGITEVDPARMQMLVERFISKERDEPPDIDVDFEHERREEVIQYIYRKYSRERAALAATVITYRPRSAIRDVGKALGMDPVQIDVLAKSLQWWEGQAVNTERLIEAGFDPQSRQIRQLIYLVDELLGFPRHLSQHVGGFVISQSALSQLVPVENAAMPERTVIQWDKDDLESLGLLKVDVLGLGMLSAIRRSFELLENLEQNLGQRFVDKPRTMADIPVDDPVVYDMICRADTMGVFQIESRAQMAMLPRLRPRNYYDLVIEVAIIRPGPIQGDMVHPYLRRRHGIEPVTYPSEAVRKVLQRTLGVPIFQEQVMQLAVVAAGFTPGEADGLRRAMAAWRRRGNLGSFEQRLLQGMAERGYSSEFAQQIFNQIKGFGEYGFPESHAASFALLAYVSAWLKCHEPAAFFCALLNSQPMGFYAPAQLIRAARSHDVQIKPVDVIHSAWDATLEVDAAGSPCIRLGMRTVKGMSRQSAERIVAAREAAPIESIRDISHRAMLNARDKACLAAANAFSAFAGNRYQARWQVAGIESPLPLAPDAFEATPLLGAPGEGQNVLADYRHLGLTLGRHPLAILRARLDAMHIRTAGAVRELQHGQWVSAAGLVITRQRPASAAGVTFVTIEDETGYLNLIVWEALATRERQALLGATLMGVKGRVQKEGEVLHIVAQHLYDYSALLGDLMIKSRNFH